MSCSSFCGFLGSAVAGGLLLTVTAAGGERTEHFDRDPGWEGRNNRATVPETRIIRQDFGYSRSHHAGRQPGELGGFITPAAEPACYVKLIGEKTFADRLEASGSFACTGRQFHVLVGFCNTSTLGAWRTPNTMALRLYGRGDAFYAYLEYATARDRAGGDSPGGFSTSDPATGKPVLHRFASQGARHTWSLQYDPQGHHGTGSITATVDDQTAVCHLARGHQADGASFNSFGLLNVMKHADSGGEVWIDDLTINGAQESFNRDPHWEGIGNRLVFQTKDVRPRFDFGFRPTHFAGGQNAGELGGLVFRGDSKEARTLASYADKVGPLKLDKPLQASGVVSLRRGVSDSTTLIGFFRAEDAMRVEVSPRSGLPDSFLGVAIEGPSREGFLFYPLYRLNGRAEGHAQGDNQPHILPDGSSHRWSLRFQPDAGGGRIEVRFDSESVALDVKSSPAKDARFDRFGIVTTRIDGNGQHIFFDDLTYTATQE